ncbi:chemotaxis protein CheW [Gammaproteobacteria bacterium AB-CW1]|uniref:Chemotaxis protein CheW n=1 Tax=Natronospira elongata TaxID=3110268 RepID=A0AAP6MLB2_9GAMM|nr:chemotaxis protein CheW [Gammaproteobacteria bacterium AB-CW1]
MAEAAARKGRRRKSGKNGKSPERLQEAREQWVTFRLGRETYGLKALHVQEILKATEISPVPGAESFVLGVINLRGNIVTVIDTRKRFGLSEPEAEGVRQIIVVEVDEHALGLLVDDVDEVADVRPSEIEPPPQFESDQVARHIQGVVRRDSGLTVMVDVRRLMPSQEKAAGAG